MFVKDLKDCQEIISGDRAALRELFNPLKDPLALGYSLARARVKPGRETSPHRLKTSEVYYILKGKGEMRVGNEKKRVAAGQAVYIPPLAVQSIKNLGCRELVFLCIVDPAWRAEDEEIFPAGAKLLA